MKLKDIEVGKEYAVGTPQRGGSFHDKVKIVRVGVHSTLHRPGYATDAVSKRATYVEVEASKSLTYTYQCDLVDDPTHPKHGKPWPAGKHSSLYGREPADLRKVNRVPASHVICLWTEHLRRQSAQKAAAKVSVAQRAAQEKADESLRHQLNARFGIDVPDYYVRDGTFKLRREDVETVLKEAGCRV